VECDSGQNRSTAISARPSISRSHLRPVTVHTADRNVSTGPGPSGQETQLAPSAARYFTFTVSRFSSDIFLCAALTLNRTEVLYSTEKHGCDLGCSFYGADPKSYLSMSSNRRVLLQTMFSCVLCVPVNSVVFCCVLSAYSCVGIHFSLCLCYTEQVTQGGQRKLTDIAIEAFLTGTVGFASSDVQELDP